MHGEESCERFSLGILDCELMCWEMGNPLQKKSISPSTTDISFNYLYESIVYPEGTIRIVFLIYMSQKLRGEQQLLSIFLVYEFRANK